MLCQKKKTQALTTYFFLIWPIFLRILLLSLLRMVDGVLARNLENPNTLTTLELGRTFIGTPTFLFMGIANMLSGIVIEADLSRSYRKSTEALTASFFIALLLLGPWTIIFCCFSKPILLYWQQPVEVVALTSSYLAITALALLPIAFKNLVQRYLQGLGKTKTNLKMTLLEAFTSVFLAYVFMYGKLGWPRMGLLGSALSFLTSQLLVAIVCGYQLTQLQRRGKVLLSFHACKQVRFKALKKIFLLGIFLGLSYSCRTAFNSAIMIIAGRLGETQLRVFSSIKTIRRPCYAIIFSVAAMGRILISKYQHQPEKKRNISHFSYILITLASFLIGAVLYLGGTPMLRWMDKTATPAFLTHCQQILPFEMLFIWIDGLAFLSIALLAGTKVTVYPAFIVFFTSFTIGCPLANILANDFNLGLEGIYIALCSSALIAFIATYGYLHHKTKNHPLATSIS